MTSHPTPGPDLPAGRARAAAMPFIMITVLIDMMSIGLIVPVLPALVGGFTTSQAEQVWWYGAVTFAFSIANFVSSPLLGALSDRYFQEGEASASGNVGGAKLVPEGIEGQVPYKGSVVGIIFQMGGGLRAAMHYCGCASIEEMHAKAEFVEITSSGMRESHVHDVQITKEAPNYRAE